MFSIPKKPIFKLVRLLALVLPFYWIFHRIDFDGLYTAILSVRWWTVPVVTAGILITMFLQGYRWWVLMRAFIPELSFSQAISAHFKGVFYSIALPTSAAQDVVRAALLSHREDYAVVWGATWLSRLTGLIVLVTLSFTGFILLGPHNLPVWPLIAIGIIGVIVILLTILTFSKTVTRQIRYLTDKIVPVRIMKIILDIRQAIFIYRSKPRALAASLGISFIVQLLLVLNTTMLVKGITGIFSLAKCLFFIPAIEIVVMSLPLTPNGMGVREGLSSLFLVSFLSFSREQVGVFVLIGFLGILLRLVGIIPVAYDAITKRRHPPT